MSGDGKTDMKRKMLWWGRFDPNYSRNRILRKLLRQNDIELQDFRPHSSFFGALESLLFDPGQADAIWVPCFRHRDFTAAKRYAAKIEAKLIFDPLISSWDKVVYERKKFPATHPRAKRLLNWEKSLFASADVVIADTGPHAEFFQQQLSTPAERTFIIPVGAEEAVFYPLPSRPSRAIPEVLFFGSFINLQGPEHIVEAARLVPELHLTLLGDGPLRGKCQSLAQDISNVFFEPWIDYERLPERIAAADLVLGIFGDSAKAARVIPNKVFQALACGRPVITRSSAAYPRELAGVKERGIYFVPPANPQALAETIGELVNQGEPLDLLNEQAQITYQTWFSEKQINEALGEMLAFLDL